MIIKIIKIESPIKYDFKALMSKTTEIALKILKFTQTIIAAETGKISHSNLGYTEAILVKIIPKTISIRIGADDQIAIVYESLKRIFALTKMEDNLMMPEIMKIKLKKIIAINGMNSCGIQIIS